MIEVSVYATNKDWVEKRSALRRRLDNDSLHVPYDDIVRANKCLFGQQAIIEFVVI